MNGDKIMNEINKISTRQISLKILFIFMFIYAIRMEASNFIIDQRGISVKMFEAILELGSILFVLCFMYFILSPCSNKKVYS